MEEKKKQSAQAQLDQGTIKLLQRGLMALPQALSAQENLRLLEQYKQTGDVQVRNQIVCGNLRFAVSFSFKYYQNLVFKIYGNRIDDLVQDLSICLVEAVEKFDLSKGFLFSTFAGAVLRNEFYTRNRQTKNLKNDFKVVSFSSPSRISQHGNVLTLEDTLMDEKFSEENLANRADVQHILKHIVPTLTQKERKIFKEFFIEHKSQAQIAKGLGVSKTYVGHIVQRIRGKVLDAYQNGFTYATEYATDNTGFQQALWVQKKRNQQILRDYYQGVMKQKDLAQKYNLSDSSIYTIICKFENFCRERNVDLPERQKPLTAQEKKKQERALAAERQSERNKQIVADFLTGEMSHNAIGKKYSMTAANVRYIISKFKKECDGQAENVQTQTTNTSSSQTTPQNTKNPTLEDK